MPRRPRTGPALPPPIRVAVVHEREFVRRGVCDMLRECTGYELMLCTPRGAELLTACRRGEVVHVALLRLQSRHAGDATFAALRHSYPQVNVLFLSDVLNAEDTAWAIYAQARGVLPVDPVVRELDAALADASAGRRHWNAVVLHAIPRPGDRAERRTAPGKPLLTARELDTLKWRARYLTERTIARVMKLKLSTVRAHMRSIRKKFGVHSWIAAVRMAQRMRLLPR